MNKSMYPKLAVTNIRKNSQTYLPYILTCIGCIMMYYMLSSLAHNEDIASLPGGSAMPMLLMFGTWVIAIFSVIFLLYTNSFLIKRRTTELGLYNILGLEKRHIAVLLVYETLIIAAISMVLGLFFGVLLSKLMFMILANMMNSLTITIGYSIPLKSIYTTLVIFAGVFVITLLYNLIRVRVNNPLELLKSDQKGEKEPKTKIISAILGVVTLSAGYYIALTVESPLDAITLFFVAVILVIAGTYSLFTAGSIALLKILRKNHRFYYKTQHFTAVSGMLYRMKQNAAGLASICILSTAVLVILSTTISLNVGAEDQLNAQYPDDTSITAYSISEEEYHLIDDKISQVLAADGITVSSSGSSAYTVVRTEREDNIFNKTSSFQVNQTFILYVTAIDTYNDAYGTDITLADDEIMIGYYENPTGFETIIVEGKTYKVVGEYQRDVSVYEAAISAGLSMDFYVKDIDTICYFDSLLTEVDDPKCNYVWAINYEAAEEEKAVIGEVLRSALREFDADISISHKETMKSDFKEQYAGFLFIGTFLGILFIMATALIIYYKQVSEGYQDKKNFEIMQKIGMTKQEIRKTINSQILMVFFLPLVTAILHICVAFGIIQKLLILFGLVNVPLYMMCTAATVLVFAIAYGIIYSVTARSYYKIINA